MNKWRLKAKLYDYHLLLPYAWDNHPIGPAEALQMGLVG